jgi:hypothetical protein
LNVLCDFCIQLTLCRCLIQLPTGRVQTTKLCWGRGGKKNF